MTISALIGYTSIDNLYLDPFSPRLGRRASSMKLSQEELVTRMLDWSLEELAASFIESGGFWSNEALLVVKESVYDSQQLVVVDGNRRLAALKLLHKTLDGNVISPKWKQLASVDSIPESMFNEVPYLLAEHRRDVQSFLGFRHVTGIKPWDAAEKGNFIAMLIDEQDMTYEQVARRIGSNRPAVRKHYVTNRVMRQIEGNVKDYDGETAYNRFVLLYMSIGTEGARQYLNFDIMGEPAEVKYPIPKDRMNELANFARWVFGSRDGLVPPMVTDTRDIDSFGSILASKEAVKYLEQADFPRLEIALKIADLDTSEVAPDLMESSLAQPAPPLERTGKSLV